MPVDKLYYEGPSANSEEMDAIIGQVPGRLIRYGTICFLAVILLFIAVSWIIEYPDIVSGPCILYATNAPKSVVPRTTGRLASLLVEEGETVTRSQPLALIHNTADYQEVLKLEKITGMLWQYLQQKQWSKIEISPSDYKNIGELQSAFQGFYGSYIQIHSFILKGLFNNKKSMLRKDLTLNDSLKDILLHQKTIYERDYSIAESDYQTKEILYKEKVIAKMELKQEESKLLGKRLPLDNLEASLMNNHSMAMAKEKEMMELDKQYYEVQSNFIQSLNKLASDIQYWKQQYVVEAPAGGMVTFPDVVQENQELTAGKEIFYIESPDRDCYAQVLMDQYNFGKISLNQAVIIQLPSYPFQEYGSLDGKVVAISRIPNKDKQYMVKVALEKGLRTNTGETIRFTNELKANAEIITKRTKLLYKFLYTVQGMFHKIKPASNKSTETINNL